MPKVNTKCAVCGKDIVRHSSQIRPMNFCSRACLGKAVTIGLLVKDTAKTSAHMSEYNKAHNPGAMDFARRAKLRNSRIKDSQGNGYSKYLGKLEHDYIAERVLGRKLRPDEIVHHIDRDKRNNRLENLVVMTRSQHARLHVKCRGMKEVMSDEFQALSISAVRDRLDCQP